MTSEKRIVRVREMTGVDVGPVVALAARLPLAPHWPREVYVNALEPALTRRRICRVAETQDGSIAGFCIVLALPPQAEIETVAVAPERQRQGIATVLLEDALNKLKDISVTEVMLEVRETNIAALACYARLGFHPSGRRPHYYADPVEDAVLLTLSIG